MKVVYIANHGQNNADDEGAVTHALRELGHEVVQVMEGVASETGLRDHHGRGFDLLLFHKWNDPAVLRAWAGNCPRAFWYFDLVDWPADPTLARRCAVRRQWMADVLPHVELGFCTDGDWVAAPWTKPDGSVGPHPKLRWLPQGADGRIVGRGRRSGYWKGVVLFAGGVKGCGEGRAEFVRLMRGRYREQFQHVPSGVYRDKLKTLVAEAAVVVCPPTPVTDRYWSNRVYNMAGFGGCVAHRSAEGLCRQYAGFEVAYYGNTNEDMFSVIDRLLENPGARDELRANALTQTVHRHLYRHRVEALLQEVTRARG